MALLAGSVTVDEDASYSGSGLALAIFESKKPQIDTIVANFDAAMVGRVADAQDELDAAQAALDDLETNGTPVLGATSGDAYDTEHARLEQQVADKQDALDKITEQADPVAKKVELYTGAALEALQLAVPIIDYFVSNAEVTVTIHTDGRGTGLQRMPADTSEDTPTKAPGLPKDLAGTIA